MKLKIFVIVTALAIGFLFGYSYKATKVEIETRYERKEIVIETQPIVTYLPSTNYRIIPIKINPDTLVRPRDYTYTYKDSITEGDTTVEIEASGWGDISGIKYKVNTIKEFSVIKPKPNNTFYLGASYTTTPTKPIIGLHIDYTIRDKVLIGTSIQLHNNNYYPGIKIGYRL